MIVREVEWGHPDSVAMRKGQRLDLDQRYGSPDSEPGPHPTAADITMFFVAYADDGEPIGSGALRKLDDEHAEIKRMFVHPAHRGSGAGPAILARLEQFARDRQWKRLVLETGHRQPDAVRFYEREGYSGIPKFGYYVDSPNSLCFEKVL
ncbi:GNAT family N-acetyltransferase [Salinibacterium sp. G-O1]|uniref:GNAT family N-acetyltransferase n=1 Tax=Salinibacterium sp. G-O1 TaxID=3046208 RepID=UPI0024BA7561|nr:GNAT family N-acetyltransferase [Salinibacterium sp. G-O1]MDJ0333810.1 GNAT family N-acetyltransferase [Salinibacterium sp. G-O1]